MLLRLQNSFAAMTAHVQEQERIANNLANANTVGFKRDRTFTQTLEQYTDVEGAPRSERVTGQWAALDQGPLEATGNPLDFAIRGDGFFVLSDDEEGMLRYSRAGRFALDGDGMLRDPSGLQVEGMEGPIRFPRNAVDVQVDHDGVIRADGQNVGQLRLVRLEDPANLQRLDNASFVAPDVAVVEADDVTVLQGHVEASNVNPLTEMTDMITHYRLFESQQKLIQSVDQVLGHVTRELGKF